MSQKNYKLYYLFIAFLLVLVATLGGMLLCIPKGELHLLLCDHHTPALDLFFRYYTQVGEWVPYAVCLILLLYKAGWSLFTLSVTVLSGLSTQIIKHIVNADRPLSWFAEHYPDVQLPLVEGVHMSRYYSFPSGHTTSFFALFFALSIILCQTNCSRTTKCMGQTLLFLLAVLGGYSRIYLSQHFAMDVLGGAIIGTLITWLIFPLMERWKDKKWWNWNLKMQKNA